MRVCANVSLMFKEHERLIDRYKHAAAAGFKAVESRLPEGLSPSDLAAALSENNLTQILINVFDGDNGERGFAATVGAREKFRESVERTIPYMKATGCKKMHILSGKSFGEKNYDEQLSTLTDNLVWAAQRLKQEDMIGLIEPINQFSAPGYFLSSYPTAVEVIKSVNSPNIKLQLDLFHMQMITGNLENNIKKYLRYTGHVQVAQAPNRFQPNAFGEVNYAYIFKILSEAGYDGFVGAEYTPSGLTTDSLDWIKEYGLSF